MSYLETRDSIRLDAWRSVFQKANRILSEQKVTVSIVEDAQNHGMAEIPAWSDGLDIFLNKDKVQEMLSVNDKLAAVLRLKGLNYHELCHVLYTPRMTDELCRRLQQKIQDTGDQTWWYAFNALEDQRIETWFTSTYGASRRYFEATILEWIIKNGSAESVVLIYGRKYLNPKIRVQAGRVFVKRYDKALYDEFKTVIDEYLTLILPQDSIKAMSLIARFVELLKQMQQVHGAPLPILVIEDNGGAECPVQGQHGAARMGRVLMKPAKRARDKAQEAIDDAIDADIAEEQRRAAEDAAKAAEGQGEGEGEGQESQDGSQGAEGSNEQGSQAGDSGSVGDVAAVNDGGEGASSSGSTADHVQKKAEQSAEKEMEDLVEQAYDDLDEVREDEQIQNDVDAMMDAVKAAEQNGRMNAAGAAVGGATVPSTDQANLAVRRVHDILSRIRQEAEPETLWRQTHGRLDARRWVQRQPHEVDVFKTWDHGNEEETGVESVILVDVSGSMRGHLLEAAMATWALKRAFDRLDIRTTVMMYDTNHSVLFQPAEKAQGGQIPVLRAGGGTDPTSGLKQAELILTKSQAPNKVLITVTDGHWGGNEDDRKRQMRRLHHLGVTSMILGLGGAVAFHGKHSHMIGHDLKSISELPKVATNLVATIMRNSIYV